MKYHYVYRITNKLKRKHYYGVRGSADPLHDLGVKYFSSSKDKDFIKDQKENPQNYKYKIIRIFKNRKDAIFLEYVLHNKFDVGINESFYNKCKQTLNGFDISGIKFNDEYKKRVYSNRISPMRGKKMSLESRQKMSKPKSTEHIEKIKINRAKQKVCNNSIMHIFNQFDELVYEVPLEENFKNFCNDRGLPASSLIKSYQRNGEFKIGLCNGMSKKYYETIKEFTGWYCLKVK